MALIICPECNSALSEHADRCPTCGCSGDVLRAIIAENKVKYAEYRKAHEARIRDRAESEWECYVAAISEAADEYNTKYREIDDRYAPTEKKIIAFAEKAEAAAEASHRKINELAEQKDKLGLFRMGARNKLQAGINKEHDKCVEMKAKIHQSVDQLKRKKNAEVEPIAEKLRAKEQQEVERIEKEVKDLTVRYCKSARDVIVTMIQDKYYLAFHIRDMLSILGILTRQEIEDNLAFSDDETLGLFTTIRLDEVLYDQNFCQLIGIGQKQVLDDYYYIALSGSAMDKARQDRHRQFEQRMAVLGERRRDLERQLAAIRYNTPAAPGQEQKPASVIKRGAAGMILAGPAGAIIGVGSAINKNMMESR